VKKKLLKKKYKPRRAMTLLQAWGKEIQRDELIKALRQRRRRK
jgi:hypothetical protein